MCWTGLAKQFNMGPSVFPTKSLLGSPEGKLLETKQIAVLAGITLYTLDVSNYPSGMYMMQFDINDKYFIKTLTVQ